MKIIITEDQVNLLNEVTNKSVKLLSKYYDIEGSDAYYLGDGKIQTRVIFTPKDFDNPMTPQYGESLCNWNIDKPFGSVIGDLTFKFMDLPKTSNVPLMGYIGNTEELEEYLEDLHRGEAENLIKRINHRRNNPLKESVDKNKKFLINIMGEDLTGKIKEIKGRSDIPKIFHRYLDLNGVKRQIEMVGPMYVVKIGGNYYLYQDQSHFYQSHNDASFGEMFMDEDGKRDYSGKILKELGLDELGLRFSDIIDIFYNEGEPLNEENNMSGMSKENIKLKNLLKKVLENKELEYSFKDRTEGVWDGNDYEIIDEDYTFKYHMIVNYVLGVGSGSVADIDVIIDDIIVDGESVYDGWVEIGYSQNAWYIDKLHDHLNDEFFNSFPFSIYPTFYGHNEEKESLNEGKDMSQNLKVKKLLQNLLENKDFNISFEDEEYVWGDYAEQLVYTPYEFKFHMIVKDVLGEGSKTVAKIDVIIDDIQKDEEDFYFGWVDDGYNEDLWYIEELSDKIGQELLEDLPISIYLTFYGHNEER
jgi:hypothetical protein